MLRRIASESGRTFDVAITRGEASDLIERRFRSDPKAARAHRKAEAKRRRLEQRLINPAANWRFGYGQTPAQESAEAKRARRDGLEAIYVDLQTWVLGHRKLGR